jgi:exopolysaccharide production protein ExoZ
MEGNMHPLLGQGWTLDYEMLFYAIFFLAMPFDRRLGTMGVIVALFALVIAGAFSQAITDGSEPNTLFRYWSRPIIILFTFGIAIGAAYDRFGRSIRVSTPLGWVAALVLSTLVVGVLGDGGAPTTPLPMKFLLWIPCVLCVFVCVFGIGGEGRFETWMHRFGDASYSTYLMHTFVLSILLRLKVLMGGPVVYIAAAVLLSNLLGWLVYTLVEIRIIRFLRRSLLPRDSTA